jgi:hypothetical protein
LKFSGLEALLLAGAILLLAPILVVVVEVMAALLSLKNWVWPQGLHRLAVPADRHRDGVPVASLAQGHAG